MANDEEDTATLEEYALTIIAENVAAMATNISKLVANEGEIIEILKKLTTTVEYLKNNRKETS